jgi:hypothetical protein
VGARFSAPVRAGPGAHPASYTMGTGSLPGVKWPGRGGDHPPSSSARVKERVELYLYSPSDPSRPVLGRTLPLPVCNCKYMYLYVIVHTLIHSTFHVFKFMLPAYRPDFAEVVYTPKKRRGCVGLLYHHI